jgi:hypothetical protein
VDFKGGDIGGAHFVADINGCCAQCAATSGCAAFTYIVDPRVCYLKTATGFKQQAGTGMQSVLYAGGGVLPAPAPPGAGASPPPMTPGNPGEYEFVPMTDDQKRRMYQLTSIFENAQVGRRGRVHFERCCCFAAAVSCCRHACSSNSCLPMLLQTELQYGYAERLYDDRGGGLVEAGWGHAEGGRSSGSVHELHCYRRVPPPLLMRPGCPAPGCRCHLRLLRLHDGHR